MPAIPVEDTIAIGSMTAIRTPLQGTDIVFITIGEITYKGTLANILAYLSANIDLSAYVQVSSIVSTLTSTATNVPSSASTVKTLKDLIDALTTVVGGKLDASAYNEHYKGTYASVGSLETAHATASLGDYALVDAGTGVDAKVYYWDTPDGWVEGGSVSISNTDALIEGSTNLYFTNARVKAAFTRENVTLTQTSMAIDGEATGTITISPWYQLLQITTDHECRIRLYTSSAKRDADSGRLVGVDPTGNHGLIFEFISSVALLSADLTPPVVGFGDSANIAYNITNLSGVAQTITVTLNHIKMGS